MLKFLITYFNCIPCLLTFAPVKNNFFLACGEMGSKDVFCCGFAKVGPNSYRIPVLIHHRIRHFGVREIF